ncbi:MAG: ferrous iron transporter B [Alphaproteobacteria bacterium]
MTAFRLALVGAPNSGKSTMFNGLTGGRAKVANYAGVTVERRTGHFTTPAGLNVELIDLPGIYGLSPRSLDERIAVEAISTGSSAERAPDALLVLVDAADLRTQLHLALQLRDLGRPMVLALNMMDLAERDGVKIDVAGLEQRLGVPVVAAWGTRKAGREALLRRLDEVTAHDAPARAPALTHAHDLKTLQREARVIANAVILEEPALHRFTRIADKFLLHPVFGAITLAAVMFLMFQAVFTLATVPMNAIDDGFTALEAWVRGAVSNELLRSFLSDGVIAGVGSVLVFLPQIVILFTFILLLEASGYMARAAFLMDEIMRRVGLNGRAFIPLLSSFACAIPGMMAARTIPGERDRLTTIMVAPLMTCSARLPVYTLIISAFIPNRSIGIFSLQGLVMFVLYALGVASAFFVAWIQKRSNKSQLQPLMMVLPTYKLPDPRDFFVNLFMRAWAFVKRAGTLILSVSVGLWFLVTFPANDGNIRHSFAGMIGSLLLPILKPIGFNLEIAIALVPGMAAREVAVGALGTVYAVQNADKDSTSLAHTLAHAWPLPTALALLAWYVFAPQCIATLAVARRETNSARWTAIMIGYLFALAFVAAGLTYWISKAAGL